jgi:hypothetical protein
MKVISASSNILKVPSADVRLLLFFILKSLGINLPIESTMLLRELFAHSNVHQSESVWPTLPGSVAPAGKHVNCVVPFVSHGSELIIRSPSSALTQKITGGGGGLEVA